MLINCVFISFITNLVKTNTHIGNTKIKQKLYHPIIKFGARCHHEDKSICTLRHSRSHYGM